MTTKTISGAYSAGYFLNSSFSAVTITSTGSVGGFGLVTTAANVQVNDSGHLQASNGAAGVSLLGSGDSLTSHAGGYIKGGQAIIATGAGANGNDGGAGAYAKTYDSVTLSGGHMVGGGGGAGNTGTFGGVGGVGGAGATFVAGGRLQNSGGYLFGGRGGAGGASTYSPGSPGGDGGNGGAGVAMGAYGVFVNSSGGVAGGYGGQGGPGGSGSYINIGGTGGDGVYMAQGGIVHAYGGFIEGGLGGPAGPGGAGGDGGAGVDLGAGGYVINRALIVGGQGGTGADGLNQFYQQLGQGGDGVEVRGAVVVNYGLISGGTGGGTPANPGAHPGNGGNGVGAVGGNVVNYGTISGGGGGYSKTFKSFCGYGVEMAGTGFITNGSASLRTAIIEGNGGHYSQGANYNGIGVFGFNGGAVTVVNWGTLSGTDALSFGSSADTLIAEAGSVLSGFVLGGAGTIELGAGSGTVSGIDANGDVTVTGFLGASSTTLMQNFGSLQIDAGGNFALGSTATVAAGKTVLDYGVLSEAGTLTVAGTVGGTGTLSLTGKLVLQNKSSFSLGDLFMTANAAKVTVASNITFGGVWLQNKGALTINANRTLDFTGTDVNLAGKGVTNSGSLEVSGSGHVIIQAPVANNGVLEANGGTLSLESGALVSGSGHTSILGGGTVVGGGVFNQAVSFGSTGTLILDVSQSYTATVSGFSTSGGTFLDLGDIGFVSANEAVFSGTSISGILTVSDGTHTAHIALSGDYLSSTFVCASDGHGGVIIHDPTQGASAPPVQIHALVAAMATVASGQAAQTGQSTAVAAQAHPVLIAPHTMAA